YEVEPGAPVFLGDHDPEQTELGHSLDHAEVEVMLDVVLDRVGKHALVDERPHRLLDLALLVRELEVHAASLWTGRAAAGVLLPGEARPQEQEARAGDPFLEGRLGSEVAL